jgi:predicted tellurium resistance membrane protein TerC
VWGFIAMLLTGVGMWVSFHSRPSERRDVLKLRQIAMLFRGGFLLAVGSLLLTQGWEFFGGGALLVWLAIWCGAGWFRHQTERDALAYREISRG